MNNIPVRRVHALVWILVICVMLVSLACGGERHLSSNAPEYPAGSVSQQDIERNLKHDARVEGFEVDGDKLIVNVNQAWTSSPPGLQQRAVGQWFGMWKAAQSKNTVEVIVRHDGADVARWTGEDGYRPVSARAREGTRSQG
ncbi:MAG TPA: hypothetical protein VNO14_00645 [Blastocatellia bacterium]|nr:hypothetical protein [Blastocatellia bacterium]